MHRVFGQYYQLKEVNFKRMKEQPRNIDRKKVFSGVLLLCGAVLLMLLTRESASAVWQVIWVSFLGLGLFLYLWGRFFSRGAE